MKRFTGQPCKTRLRSGADSESLGYDYLVYDMMALYNPSYKQQKTRLHTQCFVSCDMFVVVVVSLYMYIEEMLRCRDNSSLCTDED